MNPATSRRILRLLAIATTVGHAGAAESRTATQVQRVATVTHTPGLVAFWDFVKREPDGPRRFAAHVPAGATNDFPLDAGNYIRDWYKVGAESMKHNTAVWRTCHIGDARASIEAVSFNVARASCARCWNSPGRGC